MSQDSVDITGLWTRSDRNDDTYLSGNVGRMRFLVFKNKRKRDDNDPDYLLKLAQNIPPHLRKNENKAVDEVEELWEDEEDNEEDNEEEKKEPSKNDFGMFS